MKPLQALRKSKILVFIYNDFKDCYDEIFISNPVLSGNQTKLTTSIISFSSQAYLLRSRFYFIDG